MNLIVLLSLIYDKNVDCFKFITMFIACSFQSLHPENGEIYIKNNNVECIKQKLDNNHTDADCSMRSRLCERNFSLYNRILTVRLVGDTEL